MSTSHITIIALFNYAGFPNACASSIIIIIIIYCLRIILCWRRRYIYMGAISIKTFNYIENYLSNVFVGIMWSNWFVARKKMHAEPDQLAIFTTEFCRVNMNDETISDSRCGRNSIQMSFIIYSPKSYFLLIYISMAERNR